MAEQTDHLVTMPLWCAEWEMIRFSPSPKTLHKAGNCLLWWGESDFFSRSWVEVSSESSGHLPNRPPSATRTACDSVQTHIWTIEIVCLDSNYNSHLFSAEQHMRPRNCTLNQKKAIYWMIWTMQYASTCQGSFLMITCNYKGKSFACVK